MTDYRVPNLTESIQGLYAGKLSLSEAETAKGYLMQFFKILQNVDARINQKGSNDNENHRNAN